MIRALLALALLAPAAAHGAGVRPDRSPLGRALALVLAQSPVLRAERGQVRAQADQHAWTSKIRLSYARKSTQETAGGLDARFTLSIPLWDNSAELDAAKRRVAAVKARQQIVDAFLADVRALDGAYAKQVNELEQTHFVHDRIQYRKRQAQQGQIASADLWSDAEQGKKAEESARAAIVSTRSLLETTARRYGGDKWRKLKRLLAEHLRSLKR